jgi:serpin B
MGKWISENTNNIISPDIKSDKDQIMSIINTIYFKDQWVDKFDEKNTKPDTFYLKEGSEIKCDFMNRSYITHGFKKGEGYTSSSISFKNSSDMIFILPDKGVSIDGLISSPKILASLFDTKGYKSGKVIFKIPKFSFGSDLNLVEVLKSMGVTSAFKNTADFKGITDGMAFISNIKQQNQIAIDEKGVEAAAYTKLDMAGSAPPKDDLAEMILNRLFIYAVRSDSGAVLFIGVVNNPSEK